MTQAKAGLGFRDFDKIPRDIIIEAGYGDYFTHGIGHGIGLDIHEEPYFSQTSTETIKAGMALTDEPGIYIEVNMVFVSRMIFWLQKQVVNCWPWLQKSW